jgi:ankyrin repeat protein
LKLCEREHLNDEETARLLQLLTDTGININCSSEITCHTPLMLICSTKSEYLIGLIEALLQREDVDLSLANRFGHTALTLLCRQSRNSSLLECVQLLVNHGIDVAAKDIYNRCALHLLCQYYKGEDLIQIARMLIREDMDVKELVNCVEILRGHQLYSDADLIDDLIYSVCRNEAEVTHLPDLVKAGEEADVRLPPSQPIQPPLESALTLAQHTVVLPIF